jgi:putative glutamine amidotransferase
VKRPSIGITIGYDGRRAGIHEIRHEYVGSIEETGALPFLLAPGKPEDAPAFLDRLDGLLLSGGSDVDPELYGRPRHPKLGRVIRERDEFELALCREALYRDLPILAICRGQQVLNVATGGTLVQDLPSELGRIVDHDPRRQRWQVAHDVGVVPGTHLREILGRETVSVNSFHHQAVEQLGKGAVVSARSKKDDVIEGIEMPDRKFVLGVQWHPESFWGRPEGFRPLFEALTAATMARVGAAR